MFKFQFRVISLVDKVLRYRNRVSKTRRNNDIGGIQINQETE